ncbi:MAG: DUF504 domain-containing protein [Candidatus Hadarchaeaceae archaeon]
MNKLKWGGEDELQSSRVTILHRGAPNDKHIIEGSDILKLGRGFMRVASPEGEVEIPYHRILQIEAHGHILWEKRG